MISLCHQNTIYETCKSMAFKFRTDQPNNLIMSELFNITEGVIMIFRGNIRCNESVTIGGPIVHFHIVQTVFRIIAGDPTDGQECAEGIKQVLRKVSSGNIFSNPFY